MSLLHEIQDSLIDDSSDLGLVLLKLRLFTARLGSDVLEDWVRHEMMGYPKEIPVPDYRKASITYFGTFSNGFQVQPDVEIANHYITKYANEHWLLIDIRDPLSVIDGYLAKGSDNSKDEGNLGVSTGDLKLLLQDKIYEDFPMIRMSSRFHPGTFAKIQSSVRAKVLELTLELEKNVPGAADIVGGKPTDMYKIDEESVSNVAQQVINYGAVTNIHSSGDNATVSVHVSEGNKADLIRVLADGGLPKSDAIEFAEIVESEEPDSEHKTIGKRAQMWLGKKISQGAAATWKAGLTAGTELLTKAALKYYGIDN